MKKSLCILLAVCAIGATMTACGKKEEVGYKMVESKTCDFSFQCPESWEITHTNGMLSAINPDDISKANVTAYSFYHGMDEIPVSIEYWQTYKNHLSKTFGNITVNDEKETELGGQKVVHSDYTVSIGDEDFSCETVLVAYGEKVYTITLTQGAKDSFDENNYNDHSDEFAEILKTFRIK